mmetsp:Transcript_9199/g.13573  ORF Transcript_9199/g.13573 Transcript_9199/m.13573 type:complete len:222 (+) Transcript_9199:418-1083(+)
MDVEKNSCDAAKNVLPVATSTDVLVLLVQHIMGLHFSNQRSCLEQIVQNSTSSNNNGIEAKAIKIEMNTFWYPLLVQLGLPLNKMCLSPLLHELVSLSNCNPPLNLLECHNGSPLVLLFKSFQHFIGSTGIFVVGKSRDTAKFHNLLGLFPGLSFVPISDRECVLQLHLDVLVHSFVQNYVGFFGQQMIAALAFSQVLVCHGPVNVMFLLGGVNVINRKKK